MLAKNKKGISEIVVTIIIILLAIVVFLVVSFFVRGSKGAENIELSSACLDVEMHAVKIAEVFEQSDPSALVGYNVTVSRSSSGKNLDGVKLIIEDAEGEKSVSSENIIDLIKPLDKKSYLVLLSDVSFVPAKVTIAPFFMKKSGEVFFCESTTDELSVEA